MPPKQNTLASLLGTLTNAAPVDFDPEALDADQAGPSIYNNGGSSDSGSENEDDDEEDGGDNEYMNPRAHYADVEPSDMRKKASLSESDKLNHARYQGIKSSRAELYGGDDDEHDDEEDDKQGSSEDSNNDDEHEEHDSEMDDDEEDNDGALSGRKKQLRFADDDALESAGSDSEDEEDQATRAGTSASASIAAQMSASASQSKALKARRLEDAEKGRQVRKQIKTFERALETRIKAQSVLRDVNRLPDPAVYSRVMSGSSTTMEPAIAVLEQLLELSETLFSLRTRLVTLSASSEEEIGAVAAPATRKRKRDFDIIVPQDNQEASRTWSEISTHDQIDATLHDVASYSSATEPHRRSVLDKWSLKVTSAAATASNGNKFTQLRAVNQTPSTQIDSALAGDGLSRLISRTRVLRSESEGWTKLGRPDHFNNNNNNDTEEIKDQEVFDDSDFYSTLLKELIERRSGMISGAAGEGATAAMMLNGLNSGGKKKKANVDTRASKGRKLRYEVNDKIVNFMPPIKDRVRWGEEQIERLFRQLASSSMGVVKEAKGAYEEDEGDEEAAEEEQAGLAGLRVFG
ncbi:related to BFR2 - involved in protein transport steps at the Brefeldin A blocks [Melanopsichium pennsylvanicum]|uniref:Protein BFR2 n=2 Tax=Melanopsichium pennsylvanicum TaxID=63383 RepID=A0AAJ4XSI9_9BASI|nr:related to BFR2-involved in protein transport steps at the Brefeldin A blocks [Melanopsichium pennsylvanicum 4]SNX87131.1 related to BFR2 - involved in protein transport steps at the Brefeldin A blocks [Melanopsichium pennsylvanicum]